MSTTTNDKTLAEHAVAIRSLGRRVLDDVVEVGRQLDEAKKIAGHGRWLPWLKAEFGWTARTAQRFISVHELAGKYDNLSDLASIPLSAVYLLAQRSVSDNERQAIAERASAGNPLTIAEIQHQLAVLRAEKRQVTYLAKDVVARPVVAVGYARAERELFTPITAAEAKRLTQPANPTAHDLRPQIEAAIAALDSYVAQFSDLSEEATNCVSTARLLLEKLKPKTKVN